MSDATDFDVLDKLSSWRALAEGRALLLACYRSGTQPSDALLRRLDEARRRPVDLGEDPT